MLKTFSAALIAVTALGVKVQTQSVVQAGAESLQVVPLTCASSVDIYLGQFKYDASCKFLLNL